MLSPKPGTLLGELQKRFGSRMAIDTMDDWVTGLRRIVLVPSSASAVKSSRDPHPSPLPHKECGRPAGTANA